MAKGLTGLLLAAAVLGCSGRWSAEDRFVSFYAEVVEAQLTVLDSATAVDSALAVAQRHGMAPDDLTAFRRRMNARPERWLEVWERVMERLQRSKAQ